MWIDSPTLVLVSAISFTSCRSDQDVGITLTCSVRLPVASGQRITSRAGTGAGLP